jgi:hypothetical protein
MIPTPNIRSERTVVVVPVNGGQDDHSPQIVAINEFGWGAHLLRPDRPTPEDVVYRVDAFGDHPYFDTFEEAGTELLKRVGFDGYMVTPAPRKRWRNR